MGDSADPILLAAVILAAAWMAALAVAVVRRWPRQPVSGPATMDLGDESPAVANLLLAGFELRPEAVTATLVDLAARGVLAVDEVQPGRVLVRLVSATPARLNPYEQLVYDAVKARAVDGAVPAGALTTGDDREAGRWFRRFRDAVVAEAVGRGLTTSLLSGSLIASLLGAGTLVVIVLAAALLRGNRPPVVGPWTLVGVAELVAILAAYSGVVGLVGRQRPTERGSEVAARWLGVRRQLETGGFRSLEPAAVIVWDRYLAYATALGVAPGVASRLPMGVEDDCHAWSNVGGRWRAVTVTYPRYRPGWGRSAWLGILHGAAGTAFGCFLVFVAGRARALEPVDDLLGLYIDGLRVVGTALGVIGAVMAGWCLTELVLAVGDIGRAKAKHAVVLRARTRSSHSLWFPNNRVDRRRRFVALDDGQGSRLAANVVSPLMYAFLRQGTEVDVVVSPMLGHVRIAPPSGGNGGTRAAATH